MTDFAQFSYTQYIQSYIDAMPMDAADEYHHDLVKNECTPDLWTDIEAIRAFAAAHAFLLGLCISAGLAAHGRMQASVPTRTPQGPALSPPRRPHTGAGRAGTSPAPAGLCDHPHL